MLLCESVVEEEVRGQSEGWSGMMSAAVRLIRCGPGTDAVVILALVGCWAKDGVSESAVGRRTRQAMQTGEAVGLQYMMGSGWKAGQG